MRNRDGREVLLAAQGEHDGHENDDDRGIVHEGRERRDEKHHHEKNTQLPRPGQFLKPVSERFDDTRSLESGAEHEHAGHGNRRGIGKHRQRPLVEHTDDDEKHERPHRHEVRRCPLAEEGEEHEQHHYAYQHVVHDRGVGQPVSHGWFSPFLLFESFQADHTRPLQASASNHSAKSGYFLFSRNKDIQINGTHTLAEEFTLFS